MKKVTTFLSWLEYGKSAIFPLIRENDEAEKVFILLKNFNCSPNYRGDGGRLPLGTAVTYEAFKSILVLVELGADPNLEESHEYGRKILQSAIHTENQSILRILVMYGATLEGISYLNEHQKEFLLDIVELKERVDKARAQAETFEQNKQYQQASIAYQNVAQVWLDVSKQEFLELYQRHYLKKALACYAQAFKVLQLSPEPLYENKQTLLQHLLSISQDLRDQETTKTYSRMLDTMKTHLNNPPPRPIPLEDSASLTKGRKLSWLHGRPPFPQLITKHDASESTPLLRK